VVAQARDAVLLPLKGLGTADDDGLYQVNVLEAGPRVGTRKVKVGLRTPQQAQILSGLADGDKVLVGPVPKALLAPAVSDAGTRPPVPPGS